MHGVLARGERDVRRDAREACPAVGVEAGEDGDTPDLVGGDHALTVLCRVRPPARDEGATVSLTQYYTATTLDGFIADPDDSLDWLFSRAQEEGGPGNYATSSPVSARLRWAGRRTSGSSATSSVTRIPRVEVAYEQPGWVFTHHELTVVPGAPLEFTSGDVCSVHERMVEAAGDRNVWLVGEGDLVGQFADAGLLDEVHVSDRAGHARRREAAAAAPAGAGARGDRAQRGLRDGALRGAPAGRRGRLGSGAVHDDGYFDERVAARYDESAAEMFRPEVVEPVVDLLSELAGGGERWSSASARAGSRSRLRAAAWRCTESSSPSDGGAAAREARRRGYPCHDRRFLMARAEGTFAVAYLVFNTIMNLTTQAAQVACFRNVARQLDPGGRFVIEVGVPDLRRLPPGETTHVFPFREHHVGIDEYDVANQGLVSHHFELADGGWLRRRGRFATSGPQSSISWPKSRA